MPRRGPPRARSRRRGSPPIPPASARGRRPRRRRMAGSNAWAPSERRVTPASTRASASPRSSGPGFDSIVTSAAASSPKRSRTRPRIAAIDADGRRVGVPPPRYTDSSSGRSPVPGAPNEASAASARSAISASTASTKTSTRAAGPRAAAPAYTTKSQYGHRETQKGTCTYSATGAPAVSAAPAGSRSAVVGRLARVQHPPAVGRLVAALDLLVLGPLGLRQPRMPRREEDRHPRDGMPDEGRPDPAGDDG